MSNNCNYIKCSFCFNKTKISQIKDCYFDRKNCQMDNLCPVCYEEHQAHHRIDKNEHLVDMVKSWKKGVVKDKPGNNIGFLS